MINSDLKHVLMNVACISEEPLLLKKPIKFKTQTNTVNEIVKVYKIKKSFKMEDNFMNVWTISTLDGIWQTALYCAILSMFDRRVNQPDLKLYL